VDLHRRIAPREFPSPLTFEYLSKRLKPVPLAGTLVVTLCPEDMLLMLSIQVTKDRYLKLGKICDVSEFLRVHRGLDWARTLKEAKRSGAQRKILFALGLISHLLSTALPQEVAHKLKFHTSIQELVERASQELFHHTGDTVGGQMTFQRFHWLRRERLRDKIRPYCFRYVKDVIVPCELDRRVLSISSRLSFLYYFVRPARLVAKYTGLLLARVIRLSSSVS
jgi:hypothetical protein